ncbi:MAG: hypothetical protein R3D59_17970 [Paracoccaceae bacterium]
MSSGPARARVRAKTIAALFTLAIACAFPATAAPGADVVAASGKLTDEDFYRLVSCAAPPGGACARPALRWKPTARSSRARRIDPVYVGRQRPRAEAALTRAIGELNAAGARFRLSRVPNHHDRAEIVVYFLDLAPDTVIDGTGLGWVDGVAIDEVATLIAVDPEQTRILAAAIVVTTGLETKSFEAAILTALTRAMGLATEIDAPAYDGLSVLAHGSTAATRLGPQDLVALRQLYAAPPAMTGDNRCPT